MILSGSSHTQFDITNGGGLGSTPRITEHECRSGSAK
jgi:hypothetical protein